MAFLQRQASARGEYFKGTVIGRPVAEPEVAKPQVTERPAIDPARLQSQPKAASQGSKGTGRPIPGHPTSKSPITRPATQSPSTRPANVSPATASPATERPGIGVAPGAAAVRLTPQVKSVTSLMQHEPVRLALKQMTGRDFDFDQAAWQQWWDVEGRDLLNVQEDFSVPRKQAINDGVPMPATHRGSEPVAKEP